MREHARETQIILFQSLSSLSQTTITQFVCSFSAPFTMNNDDDNNNPKESSSPDKPSSAEKQQLSHETPQAGDAENVTVTVAVTPTKKRRGARKEEAGATSSGVQKPKRKVELLDPPTRDPDCVVCGKHFHSWKALFGHMRSHPDRQWRGVFPPPTGTWDPFGLLQEREEIASTLLSVAEGVLASMNAAGSTAEGNEGGGGDEASASLPRRGGLGFDLNEPQEEGSGSKSPKFDLNLPAPEKDDEEDSASS